MPGSATPNRRSAAARSEPGHAKPLATLALLPWRARLFLTALLTGALAPALVALKALASEQAGLPLSALEALAARHPLLASLLGAVAASLALFAFEPPRGRSLASYGAQLCARVAQLQSHQRAPKGRLTQKE